MYEVKLSQFSGPLDKLLELIEIKKLEITSLNLAAVTGDFLDYLKTLGKQAEPAVLADFLVVAAKLVLIKSKTLLPDLTLTDEEEAEIKDLELRLKIYREFAARSAGEGQLTAAQNLKNLWDRRQAAFGKPLLASLGETRVFYPAPNLTLENISRALTNLTATLEEFLPKKETIKSFIINLEEKMKELVNRLTNAIKHSFRSLTTQRSKQEVVVTFLAILHLLRDRSIEVEQTEYFGDIIIKKTT